MNNLKREVYFYEVVVIMLLCFVCGGCASPFSFSEFKRAREVDKGCRAQFKDLHRKAKCQKIGYTDTIVDSSVYTVYDWETWYFRVRNGGGRLSALKLRQANVPQDAIKYGLVEFVQLRSDYPYLDRITSATQQGIRDRGYVHLYCMDGDYIYPTILIGYNPDSHYLVFSFPEDIDAELAGKDADLYTIDLIKVDVSLPD